MELELKEDMMTEYEVNRLTQFPKEKQKFYIYTFIYIHTPFFEGYNMIR